MQSTALKDYTVSVEIDQLHDRSGSDLPNMPLKLPSGSDVNDCVNQCNAESTCVAIAFDRCGKVDCWLKHSVPNSSGNSCRVSHIELLASYLTQLAS